MSSSYLVICDKDESYTARLAAYFNGKRELAFQVKTCKMPEEVQEFLADSEKGILLLHEDFFGNVFVKEWRGEIWILSESRRMGSQEEVQSLFKYQPAGRLLIQILEKCEEQNIEGIWRVRKSTKSKVVGFFSPIRRIGQTTFALEKARELSKEANVLYLNMETYAGSDGYFEAANSKTLSTLLYYAKQESDNVGMILTTLVCSKNGVDYIPPAAAREDLYTVAAEEWIWLFRKLLHNTIYDILILDMHECIQGLYEILKFCDDVYMLTADDRIAASKIKQYEDDLRQMGYGEVAERMIRCDIRGAVTGKNFGQSGLVQRN